MRWKRANDVTRRAQNKVTGGQRVMSVVKRTPFVPSGSFIPAPSDPVYLHQFGISRARLNCFVVARHAFGMRHNVGSM